MSGAPDGRSTAAAALWNLRGLALFLVGPVLGVALVAGVFGLPPALLGVAGAVFLFSLALLAVLVRGEQRRLARLAPPARRPRAG